MSRAFSFNAQTHDDGFDGCISGLQLPQHRQNLEDAAGFLLKGDWDFL